MENKPAVKIGNHQFYHNENGLCYIPIDPKLLVMTAKEMFIDLNFRCVRNDDNYITYRDIENEDLYVCFYKTLKVVDCIQAYDYNFDFKMLKAINKQIEELGWDNE